jgi:hypothetical protein
LTIIGEILPPVFRSFRVLRFPSRDFLGFSDFGRVGAPLASAPRLPIRHFKRASGDLLG